MMRDPIVEEIHRIRERMWEEAGGDLDRLIEALRATEAQHRDRIVRPEKLHRMPEAEHSQERPRKE